MENERRRFLAATTALGITGFVPFARLVRGADAKDEKKDQPDEDRG
jgi:hypothetical protein